MNFQKSVIYSHDDFIVVSKPANVSFHGNQTEAGFASALQTELGQTLFPVHRLDRITSGLLLFARNQAAARELGRLFEEGEIAKFYLAISDQKPAKKQGWVKGFMEKGRNGCWRLSREHGVAAVTQFFSYGLSSGLRLFIVRPRTGRTHQIRVALKSLGSPILGDARYGGSNADRGYLHAWAVCFTWQGEQLSFTLPPQEGIFFSDEVTALLAETGQPWTLPWPEWQKPRRVADND